MKRPEYAAGVVRIYRKYIDCYLKDGKEKYRVDEADRRELLRLFNRDGFSGGYYEQHNGKKYDGAFGPAGKGRGEKSV